MTKDLFTRMQETLAESQKRTTRQPVKFILGAYLEEDLRLECAKKNIYPTDMELVVFCGLQIEISDKADDSITLVLGQPRKYVPLVSIRE